MGDSLPQKLILISLAKPGILKGSWWEFRRGKSLGGVVLLLDVRGQGTERGAVQLLPKLAPFVLVLSLCLHLHSFLPWTPVVYGLCQLILQLQGELTAQG